MGPVERPKRLKGLLGSVVPDELDRRDCADGKLWNTIAELTWKFMVSVAAEVSRPGGFLPAFRLLYKDGPPMVTVGGVLPSKGGVPAVKALIGDPVWPGTVAELIIAPLLTLREAAVLQAELPAAARLERSRIRDLGFDLEESQIRAFEEFYRFYPWFAQIVA